MNFKDILEGVFDENSEEFEIISDTYNLITSTVPSVAAECKTNLILLDNARIKLSTLYYMLYRNISKIRRGVESIYNAQYTRLVKVGRPSKDAIEAEIKASSPDYLIASQKIEDYEAVRDLISMYIRCVDNTRSSTLEILKNIYRVD